MGVDNLVDTKETLCYCPSMQILRGKIAIPTTTTALNASGGFA